MDERQVFVLVLSRKVGEKLIISHPLLGDVVISINRLSGNRATLGIEADHEVKVIRGELGRHGPPPAGCRPDVVRVPLADILAEAAATPKKGHEPLIDFDGDLER
jgi:sRNA-binding carbon storage regulator CsrA